MTQQYVSRAGNIVSRQRAEQLRHPERLAARGAVHDAIVRGKLPSPTSQACVDCGKAAKQYDHYLGYEPEHRLDVQPVCRKCHYAREMLRRPTCRRGHVWAEVGSFTRHGKRICRACSTYGARPKNLEGGRHASFFITSGADEILDRLVAMGFARNRSEAVRRLIEETARLHLEVAA